MKRSKCLRISSEVARLQAERRQHQQQVAEQVAQSVQQWCKNGEYAEAWKLAHAYKPLYNTLACLIREEQKGVTERANEALALAV